MPTHRRPPSRKQNYLAGLLGLAINLFVWGWLIVSMHSDMTNPLAGLFSHQQPPKPVHESEVMLMHMNLPGGGTVAEQDQIPAPDPEPEMLTSTAQVPDLAARELIEQPVQHEKITSQEEFEEHLDLHLAAHSQSQTTQKPADQKELLEALEKVKDVVSLITPEEMARQSLLKEKPAGPEAQTGMNNNMFWKSAQKRLHQATNPFDLSNGSGNSKDIRFFSIRKRLKEHLITSCKIALNHACQPARRAFMTGASPSFRIEVNADGSLACLKLATSSGSDPLDNTFLKAIEDAQPFPELPKHLGITRYSITDEVMVQ